MNTLTVATVVDELTAQLSERRQRQQAYVALARAIVADEAESEREDLVA